MTPLVPECYLLGHIVARLVWGGLVDPPKSTLTSAWSVLAQLLDLIRPPAPIRESLDQLNSLSAGPIEPGSPRAAEIEHIFHVGVEPFAAWSHTALSPAHSDAYNLGFVLFQANVFAQRAVGEEEVRPAVVAMLGEANSLLGRLQLHTGQLHDVTDILAASVNAVELGAVPAALAKLHREVLIDLGGEHLTQLAGR